MIKIGICDDSFIESENLRGCLEKYCGEKRIKSKLYTYSNGDDLLEDINARDFDILFLDVIMPGKTGIDIAREIRKINPKVIIIFVSSTRDFAVDSYEVNALYYCIKPATFHNVTNIMERALGKIEAESGDYIYIESFRSIKRVNINEIIYIESSNKDIYINSRSDLIKVRMKLDEIEEKLNENFLRIHKSYLVNLKYVEEINSNKVVLINGEELGISRSLKERVFTEYYNYIERQYSIGFEELSV